MLLAKAELEKGSSASSGVGGHFSTIEDILGKKSRIFVTICTFVVIL
jgi:hypothetical protein